MNSDASTKTIVRLYPDGDEWCALIGINIVEGTVGFGTNPMAALQNLRSQLPQDQWDSAIVQFSAALIGDGSLFCKEGGTRESN
jgi:hypothetical protein